MKNWKKGGCYAAGLLDSAAAADTPMVHRELYGIAISIAALQGLQHEACVNIVCLGSIENCDGLYLTKGCLHALLQRHNKLYTDYADYVSCTACSKH